MRNPNAAIRIALPSATAVLALAAAVACFAPLQLGQLPAIPNATFSAWCRDHTCIVGFNTHPFTPVPPPGTITGPYYQIRASVHQWHDLGYIQERFTDPAGPTSANIHFLLIPFWLIAILLTLCTLLLARRLFRKTPTDLTARPCPNCSYDLRGGHTTCPECGAPTLRFLSSTP